MPVRSCQTAPSALTSYSMSQSSPEEKPPLSILLLGEGDFSFAYDLARFIATNGFGTCTSRKIQFVATGIDSKQELHSKYKDAAFLVENLESLDQASCFGSKDSQLHVDVCYGTNAILPLETEASQATRVPKPSDHVIFNHPHLGVEAASLHAQFLNHLFHSVVHGWMLEDGCFYLTLIGGQWERWEGGAAADKFGLELVDRSIFQPPTFSNEKSYYKQRRHQSGRSFASRAEEGSETFTFRRKGNKINTHCNIPFWVIRKHEPTSDLSQKVEAKKPANGAQEGDFVCQECQRTFREERSLKSHMKAKHGAPGAKRKRESFDCSKCERTFESLVGLQDHMVAKHAGLHSDIKPDWVSKETNDSSTDETLLFCCPICGVKTKDSSDHMKHFIPVLDSSYDAYWAFSCTYCDKRFRELRAQLQHENFCSQRKTKTKL